jgi:hypothetical protein
LKNRQIWSLEETLASSGPAHPNIKMEGKVSFKQFKTGRTFEQGH